MTPSATPSTPTTLLGKMLRICAGDDVLLDPRRQPVRRRIGVLERHQRRLQLSRDLGLRPAQPVALLVRQATGDMVIGDVGQSRDEEIDFAHPGQNVGANYGWPCYEGFELNATGPGVGVQPAAGTVVAPVLSLSAPATAQGSRSAATESSAAT